MVVGGATVQSAAVAQGGGGHGSGSSVQLTDDGGLANRPAPCRRGSTDGAAAVSVAAVAGNTGISPRRRDGGGAAGRLVVESLLGNERRRFRYGGAEVRSGAVAKVVSRGESSQGSLRASSRCWIDSASESAG